MVARWVVARKNRLFLELLSEVAAALEARGIPYWLDWGTLLGAWRGGALLEHDTDVDLGVPARYQAELRARPPEGRWSVRDSRHSLFFHRPVHPVWETLADLVVLQLQFVDEGPESLAHQGDPSAVPRTLVYPLASLPLASRSWPVPAQPGRYLECLYGYLGAASVYAGRNRYRPCRSWAEHAAYRWNRHVLYPLYFLWKAWPCPRRVKERLQEVLGRLYGAGPKT